jgi:hypothetical protein
MPGNYDGRPGQIATESFLTVTGATFSNPITITVSGSLPAEFFLAGYGGNPAGPLVNINGVEGNLAANGIWTATPTGASTFTIPVAGNGLYTTGGTVQPLYLKQMYTLPSDGDADNSASIASWGQGAADRSQWLASRTGFVKLAGRVVMTSDFGPSKAVFNLITTALTAGTWYQLTCANALTVAGMEQGCLGPLSIGVPGQPTVYSAFGFQAVDIPYVSLDCNLASDGDGFLGLWASMLFPSGSPSFPGSYSLLTGSVRRVPATSQQPVHLAGYPLPHQGPSLLFITPAFYALSTRTYTITVQDDLLFQMDALRVTGMPQ